MPTATVRGANIHYEVLGDDGPWVALTPGGRTPASEIASLAQRIADAGHRVVIHDRRNTGASDLVLEAEEPEYQIWADDLHALLGQLDALPAWIGGASSGARLAMTLALTQPDAIRGLLLCRVTGGVFAAESLAHRYYGQFADAARAGGMEAVCETEHFRERIAERPEHRQLLLSIDPDRFVDAMNHWGRFFADGADLPVIGMTPQDIARLTMPTIVVPGNDNTHSRPVGERLHALLPDAELHLLFPEQQDVDLVAWSDWASKEAELAEVFVDFMRRH